MTVLLNLPRTPQDVGVENFDQFLLIYDALWLLAGEAGATTSFAAGIGIELETLPSGAIKISATAPAAFSTSGGGASVIGARTTSTQFFKSIAVGPGLEISESDDTITISAAAILTINWDDVVGKPLTFPPSAHTHSTSDINIPTTSNYTENLQGFLNHMHSPGLITGCGLSLSPTAGSVRIAAGEVLLRVADDDYSDLREGLVTQTDFAVPSNLGARFFGAVLDVPNNTINLEMRTASNWNKDTEIPLGGAINIDGTLFLFANPFRVADPITNIIQRFDSIAPLQRDGIIGGLILSAAAGRTIQVTAGVVWARLNDWPFGPFDSAGTHKLITAYKNVAGWVFTQNVTQWDNLQYNNVASGLVTLGNNKWANHWYYILGDGNTTVVSVYGQAEYTTQTAAESEPAPSILPPNFSNSALLIGRLTFQKSAAAASSVASVFLQPLGIPVGSVPTDHNNLTGIQGGAAGEYYHLTTAQLASISNIATTYLKVDGSNSMAGNLNFSGNSRRITGTFHGSPQVSRTLFQSNATDSGTTIGALPTGAGIVSQLILYGAADPDNCSALAIVQINGTETSFRANTVGSGAYNPITLWTGGIERLRLATGGAFNIQYGAIISPGDSTISVSGQAGCALRLLNSSAVNYGRTLELQTTGIGSVDGPFVVLSRSGSSPVNWHYGISQTSDSTDFYIGIVDNAFGDKKFRFKTDGRLQITGSMQTTQLLLVDGSPYTQIFFGNRQVRKSTGHDLEIVNNANSTVTHVLYDDGRLYVRSAINSDGYINTTSNEMSIGAGVSGEKRLRFYNANTNAYFYLGDAGDLGLYDVTRAAIRFTTSTSGDFKATRYISATRLGVNIDNPTVHAQIRASSAEDTELRLESSSGSTYSAVVHVNAGGYGELRYTTAAQWALRWNATEIKTNYTLKTVLLHPILDNSVSLGTIGNRWTVVYAVTGSINVSDARQKTEIKSLHERELVAAQQLAKEIGTFKFLDAIYKKGDLARTHIGMTVQRAIQIMVCNGLNPVEYGFICYDIKDDRDYYGFRTDELLLFIARGLEARLSKLEALLESSNP